MSCLTSLIFNIAYYAVLYGYSGYQVVLAAKEEKTHKIWALYFLVVGLLTIFEGTVLFPVKYILGLICCNAWKFVKILFCLWLYHPTYRGALLLEQIGGKYIDMAYNISWGAIGPIIQKIGVPERQSVSEEKKTQ